MTKLLVVGGGPAGTACAITAARSGIDTLLFESGIPGREKICGDGLGPDAQRALARLGLLHDVAASGIAVQESVFIGPYGEEARLPLSFITLPRAQLDLLLQNAALDAGASLLYGTQVTSVSVHDDGVVLTDARGVRYDGDMLVLATGAKTHLAKQAGFSIPPAQGIALRAYAENKRGEKNAQFWFTKDLLPAYAWAFPCPGGVLNVGLGYFSVRKPARSLDELFADFMSYDAASIVGPLLAAPKRWPLRTGLLPDYCSDRILVVGENAHTTYDLSGEGIGKALESGTLAADAIKSSSPMCGYAKETLHAYCVSMETTMRPWQQGYTAAMNAMHHPLKSAIITHTLSHSEKARSIATDIFDERRKPEALFSLNGFISALGMLK